MSKRSVTLGLLLAFSIASAVWAHRSATASMTSRMSSVAPAAEVLPIDSAGGSASRVPRRLLGLSGFALIGVVLVYRFRRPLTI